MIRSFTRYVPEDRFYVLLQELIVAYIYSSTVFFVVLEILTLQWIIIGRRLQEGVELLNEPRVEQLYD